MSTDALRRACAVAGSQTALAGLIGTRQSVVWYWLWRARRGVPAEFALAIERATGVPRSELRPDLYGAGAVAPPPPAAPRRPGGVR